MNMSTSTSSSRSAGLAASPQEHQRIFTISCTACRQRKVKCSRIQPCLPCQKAGYDCEYPQRKRVLRKNREKAIPTAKVADLAHRLAGVEALLSQMRSKEGGFESTSSSADDDMDGDGESWEEVEKDQIVSKGQYAGCSFWQSLCEQIGGLHELVTESNSSLSSTPNHEDFSNLITTSKPTVASSINPTRTQAIILLEAFISNIDPIIKVLHIPSLRQQINSQFPINGSYSKQRQIDVLTAAVFFASVTSMTEEECQTHLSLSKKSAVFGFKSMVEDGLARSHFMGRANMTSLQALVIFIGCLRSTDTSRAPWTMVAVVVRLAHSLNLHRDDRGLRYTPFEAEMRRRLWWQIVLLDMRASEDWYTDFIIPENSYNTRVPTNINDCDMVVGATSTYTDFEGVTEMTFGLVFQAASKTVKLLRDPLDERQCRSPQERLKIVLDCQKELNEDFFPRYEFEASISWATNTIGRLVIYKAWLLVHYPMKSQDWTAMETTVKREDLLMTSTMILELSYKLESNQEMRKWRWLFETYIQWHALAVTLVELCVQSPSPLKDKAWAIVDIVYDLWAKRVVDTSDGTVWWPIKKLHAKANELRISSTSSPSMASEPHNTLFTPATAPREYNNHQAFVSCTQAGPTLVHHDQNNNHEFWESNPNMAFDLQQTDLVISNFDIDGWDYAQMDHHNDPSMHANWIDWDMFMQDTMDYHIQPGQGYE